MSPTVIVSAAKTSPESKIGIKFEGRKGKIILKDISPSGLFASTNLQVGQEIVSINGTSISGKNVPEVLAMLVSIQKDVTIEARMISAWRAVAVKPNYNREVVPTFLKQTGVPISKWERICDSLESELVPAVNKSKQMDSIFRKEIMEFTGKQMAKGYIGFGQESHHEKKVHQMAYQCSALANNATLAATNVLAKANALLNTHGVMCVLTLETTELPKYSTKQTDINTVIKPCGLDFYLME